MKKRIVVMLIAVFEACLTASSVNVHAAEFSSAVAGAYTDILRQYLQENSNQDAVEVNSPVYGIIDINGDEIPELFISEGSFNGADVYFYTSDGNRAYEIGNITSSYGEFWIDEGNNLIKGSKTGQGNYCQKYYKMEGNSLALIAEFAVSDNWGKFTVNGTNVNYDELQEEVDRMESRRSLTEYGAISLNKTELTESSINDFYNRYCGDGVSHSYEQDSFNTGNMESENSQSAESTFASESAGSTASYGMIYPDSNSRVIPASEYQALSYQNLRLAVNEIYARHGYIFHSEDLQSYFESFSWYTPRTSDMNAACAEMNTYEKKNLEEMGAYYSSRQ